MTTLPNGGQLKTEVYRFGVDSKNGAFQKRWRLSAVAVISHSEQFKLSSVRSEDWGKKLKSKHAL